jgi:hypothetical protein
MATTEPAGGYGAKAGPADGRRLMMFSSNSMGELLRDY